MELSGGNPDTETLCEPTPVKEKMVLFHDRNNAERGIHPKRFVFICRLSHRVKNLGIDLVKSSKLWTMRKSNIANIVCFRSASLIVPWGCILIIIDPIDVLSAPRKGASLWFQLTKSSFQRRTSRVQYNWYLRVALGDGLSDHYGSQNTFWFLDFKLYYLPFGRKAVRTNHVFLHGWVIRAVKFPWKMDSSKNQLFQQQKTKNFFIENVSTFFAFFVPLKTGWASWIWKGWIWKGLLSKNDALVFWGRWLESSFHSEIWSVGEILRFKTNPELRADDKPHFPVVYWVYSICWVLLHREHSAARRIVPLLRRSAHFC